MAAQVDQRERVVRGRPGIDLVLVEREGDVLTSTARRVVPPVLDQAP